MDKKETPNIYTLQRASYQKIISEPDAGYNPATFEKVLPLAKFGLPEAQFFVGEYYMYHDYETGHKKQAEYWLRLSAEQYYPPAELALGEWLFYGRHTFKTDPECEQWLLQSAKHQETRACYFLGELEKDKGNMTEACQWWLKGSESDDEWSQCELAFCFETAQGVPYDLDAAIAWYKRAALQERIIGNADVYYQIAVLKKYAMEKFADLSGWASDRFWEGENEMLRGNLAKAVSLWQWIPDPRAMVMKAWQMLHVVKGVVEKEGEDYFDDDEMFFEEEEESIKAVAEFFSKQNHPAAYYLMGYLYEYNICYIKKDIAKASHWYGKAAAAGDEVAAWKLKKMEEKAKTKEDNNQ
jgi:TPR repeat protein